MNVKSAKTIYKPTWLCIEVSGDAILGCWCMTNIWKLVWATSAFKFHRDMTKQKKLETNSTMEPLNSQSTVARSGLSSLSDLIYTAQISIPIPLPISSPLDSIHATKKRKRKQKQKRPSKQSTELSSLKQQSKKLKSRNKNSNSNHDNNNNKSDDEFHRASSSSTPSVPLQRPDNQNNNDNINISNNNSINRNKPAMMIDPKQEQAKQEKRAAQRADTALRRRWKYKKRTTAGEVDIGGAVECMARKVLQQKGWFQTHSVLDAKGNSYTHQTTTTQQQQQIQIQNTTLTTEPERTYYEQGLPAPRKQDLEFYFGEEHIPLVPKPIPENDNYLPLDKFPYLYRRVHHGDGLYHYFTTKHSVVKATFLFERIKRNFAAKYLTGCAGLDTNTDHRLIKLLHQSELQIDHPVHREQLVLIQASDQALDLQLLHTRKWKHRQNVVSQLNINSNAPSLVGYSMQGSILKPCRQMRRTKLENAYGLSTIVKKHADANTAVLIPTHLDPSMTQQRNDESSTTTEASESDSEYDSMSMSTSTDRSSLLEWPDATPDIIVTSTQVTTIPPQDENDPAQYLHVAGTNPPIPSFPLDESNIVFGRVDQNVQIARAGRIETSIFVLTTSTLMCQWGAANADNDHMKAQEIHNILLSYVESLTTRNCRDPTKNKWIIIKGINHIPMLVYYQSFLHLFSFIANSGTFRKSIVKVETSKEYDNDNDLAERRDMNVLMPVSMTFLGQRIYEAFVGHRIHHGLKTFPRLQLSFAIASVAGHLPSSAAEIISRPLDDTMTASDLVRQVLVHMEVNQMLTDDSEKKSSSSVVHVGQLEHYFHQAIMVLQECQQMSFDEKSDYACWHIAFLAASLVLSSGIKIGAGAYTMPSSIKKQSVKDIFSQVSSKSPKHEIRHVLAKFQETKQQTASALRDLIESCQQHLQVRTSQAICSLLEWGDLVALLVGPSRSRESQNYNSWEAIRRIHAHHFIHWTSSIPLSTRSPCIEAMVGQSIASKNSFLDALATCLENEPGNIQHWRRLVQELGPVGLRVSEEQRLACRKCADCRALRKGLNIDHISHCEKDWWGSGRAWWIEQLLSCGTSKSREKKIFVYSVSQLIEATLLTAGNEIPVELPVSDLFDNTDLNFDWMNVTGDDNAITTSAHQNAKERNKNYTGEIPKSPFKSISNKLTELDSLVDAVSSRNTEVCCYKVILACHLGCVTCESVLHQTWQLAKACVPINTLDENDSWRGLLWLSQQGLHIPQTLFHFHESLRAPSIEKPRCPYTQAEKDAMLEGVLFHGLNCRKIHAMIPMFKEWSFLKVRELYKWMQQNEGV